MQFCKNNAYLIKTSMLILKILAQLKRLVKFMINTKLKVGFFKKRNGE